MAGLAGDLDDIAGRGGFAQRGLKVEQRVGVPARVVRDEGHVGGVDDLDPAPAHLLDCLDEDRFLVPHQAPKGLRHG